jgi:hypothetical protein
MRDLYIILSVAGWAWCAVVGIFLWLRLRPGAPRSKDAPAATGQRPAAGQDPGPLDGREEVRA